MHKVDIGAPLILGFHELKYEVDKKVAHDND